MPETATHGVHPDAPPDPASDPIGYSYKPSLIGAGSTFRLAPDALEWEIGRYSGRLPYRAIRRIRLAFRPMTISTHRFTAEIWSSAAPKLVVASTSWRSFVEHQRQDAEYKAFVRALSRRVAAAGGTVEFATGSPPLLYWPGVAVFAALALALPAMLLNAARAGAPAGAAIVAALLLVFFWQLGMFFWRNRPGLYDPYAVPPQVLPRG